MTRLLWWASLIVLAGCLVVVAIILEGGAAR